MVANRMCTESLRPTSLVFLAVVFSWLTGYAQQNPGPQGQSSAPPKVTAHDSVEVVAHLAPEEVEEGKLNDLYDPIATLLRRGSCTPEIIQRFETEVIPRAEKSTFEVPRNKFLYLANRDIGNCQLAEKQFPEAESSFRKILAYAPIWPGIDDSAYPINFRQIATAQMGQQHWKEAEESLMKSVTIFDTIITTSEKQETNGASGMMRNFRGSQSLSYALLAVAYLQQGRSHDALAAVDTAYREVTEYKLDPKYRNQVVQVGKRVAEASGDAAAMRTWSERNPTP
jgi:tetratricopeptide (TPR) repeat protein